MMIMPIRQRFLTLMTPKLIKFDEIIFTDNQGDTLAFGNGAYATLRTITLQPSDFARPDGGIAQSLQVEYSLQGPSGGGPLTRILINSVQTGNPSEIDVSDGAATSCLWSVPVIDPNFAVSLEIQGKSTAGGNGTLSNVKITARFIL